MLFLDELITYSPRSRIKQYRKLCSLWKPKKKNKKGRAIKKMSQDELTTKALNISKIIFL